MSNNINSVSPYLESQFPQFVSENHPRFIEFIKSYYEWMESNNKVLYDSKKLLDYQDIDYSNDPYIEQFFKEFLPKIPRSIVANKSLLLKNIKQFYRARGTEKSYRLFFRFLYGLSASFYYPRVDILRVSDGKWIQQKSIRIFSLSGNILNFQSNRIRGRLSNCTAYVEKIYPIIEGNYVGYELVLNNSSITSEFIPEEIIENETSSITARVSAIPSEIKIVNPGLGYAIGMKFDLNVSGVPGFGARIEVISVDNLGRIEKVEIKKYGLGYDSTVLIENFPLTISGPSVIATIDVNFGTIASYPGYYLNNDGQLSTSKYIQDGYFYQQFSYVVFVDETISRYKKLLLDILHPAGFKFFGGVRMERILDGSLKFPNNSASIFKIQLQSSANASVELHTKLNTIISSTKNINSNPLGPKSYSVYRERFNYKPVSKYNANDEISQIPNYFGVFGDLSAQKAITPIYVFDDLGLTPKNIDTEYNSIKLSPDAVIKTET